MAEIEAKLQKLGLALPEPLKTPPGLKLPFKPVIVRGRHVYISGHAPQNPDGSIAGPLGKLGKELTVEQGYQAAKLVGLSILGDLKRALGDLDGALAHHHRQGRNVDLAAQDRELVSEHHDLELLVALGAEPKHHKSQQASRQHV